MAHLCRVAQRDVLPAIRQVRRVQKAVPIEPHADTAASIVKSLRPHDSSADCYTWPCVKRGGEPDDEEEMGVRLDRPLQPKIQAACAEVVELRVQGKPLTRGVNASDCRRKRQIDSQRSTALHVVGEHRRTAGEG